MKNIAKYVVEIRFDPSPFILDKRGAIAADISSKYKFSDWQISNNRIDFFDPEKNITAFLSYRNLGIVIPENEDGELIADPAKDFIKTVWNYFPSDKITHYGVRAVFFTEKRSFSALLDKFRSKFLKINDEVASKIGGEIVDVGFPIHFVDGEAKFNINTGPMEKKQASQFFAVEDEALPDVGVFLDADYFIEGFKHDPKLRELLDFIDKGIEKTKSSKEAIENILK